MILLSYFTTNELGPHPTTGLRFWHPLITNMGSNRRKKSSKKVLSFWQIRGVDSGQKGRFEATGTERWAAKIRNPTAEVAFPTAEIAPLFRQKPKSWDFSAISYRWGLKVLCKDLSNFYRFLLANFLVFFPKKCHPSVRYRSLLTHFPQLYLCQGKRFICDWANTVTSPTVRPLVENRQ
jgi:hypothetical protein